MPNKTATKKGFTCPPEKCYANRHMTGAEFKVYDVMVGYAKSGLKGRGGEGPLLFTGSVVPLLCNELAQSRTQIDRHIKSLARKGWIIWRGRDRKPDGTETPNAWEVLEHPDYAARYPGTCPDYLYAPDRETADAYGVKRGEKASTAALPANFDLPAAALIVEVDEEAKASCLSEKDAAQTERYLKRFTHAPGRSRKPVSDTTHGKRRVVEGVTTHGKRNEPLTGNETNHSREAKRTTHGNPRGILVTSAFELQPCNSTPSSKEKPEAEAEGGAKARKPSGIDDELLQMETFWKKREGYDLPERLDEIRVIRTKIAEVNLPGRVFAAFRAYQRSGDANGLKTGILIKFLERYAKWEMAADAYVKAQAQKLLDEKNRAADREHSEHCFTVSRLDRTEWDRIYPGFWESLSQEQRERTEALAKMEYSKRGSKDNAAFAYQMFELLKNFEPAKKQEPGPEAFFEQLVKKPIPD